MVLGMDVLDNEEGAIVELIDLKKLFNEMYLCRVLVIFDRNKYLRTDTFELTAVVHFILT